MTKNAIDIDTSEYYRAHLDEPTGRSYGTYLVRAVQTSEVVEFTGQYRDLRAFLAENTTNRLYMLLS